jgi:G3E family GTPase
MKASQDRTPVSIITGFLGSGKTTLLNQLLQHPQMAGSAVIVNEFGEIGLDHLLIATPSENTVLLSSGCICCTVRGDLVDTLRDLDSRRRNGEVPAFDNVLIETTGLADPVPIIQTVVTDDLLATRFRLDSVITLVDGVNGMQQLDRQFEAVKQAAVADRLLLTKTDLASQDAVDELQQRLLQLNPAAQIHRVLHGRIAPQDLCGSGLAVEAGHADIRRWLREDAYGDARTPVRRHAHDDHIRSFCVRLDQTVSAAGLTAWLTALASLRGAGLLRVKGLLNVDGQPVAVHAVQTLIHEPLTLACWPDDERCSRLVFIVRDMTRADIEDTLDVLRWQSTPQAGPGQTLDPRAYARFVAALEKFH